MVKAEILESRIKLLGFVATIVFNLNTSAFAGSALWDSAPASEDWNTANNWTPDTVPNGASDTSTFATSTQTAVFISADTEVNSITFNSGASAFTITANAIDTLTISGNGIANNSGITQNFATAVDGSGNAGVVQFTNGASAGTLTAFSNNGSTISGGAGGVTQFNGNSTAGNGFFTSNGGTVDDGFGGSTAFFNNSTAGSGIFITNGSAFSNVSFSVGGITSFHDNATAGNATFTNNTGTAAFADQGITQFFGTSTAGHGTFTNNGSALSHTGGGVIEFHDSASAGNATFTNNAGTVNGAANTLTIFWDTSTADHGTFITNGAAVSSQFLGAGGITQFVNTSTAANGTFIVNGGTAGDGGRLRFLDSSTAGNATLIANGGSNGGAGGAIQFEQGLGTGGTARVEVFGNGNLDISSRNGPGVTIGSLEGNGNVFVGENNLTVGSNNLSTTFSGVIARAPSLVTAANGSLTKIGTGTLTLSGTNGYQGPTVISAGKLNVDSSINSAVSVNSGGTLGGSGTVRAVTVNSGGTLSPGNSPGILNVQGNLTLNLGATYLVDLNGIAVGTQYDQANVIGAVNLANATLSISLGFMPNDQDNFIIINNDGTDAVTGIFNGLAEGATITAGGEAFKISYQSGDGNDVGLTATAAVPEPSTSASLIFGATVLFFALRKRQI